MMEVALWKQFITITILLLQATLIHSTSKYAIRNPRTALNKKERISQPANSNARRNDELVQSTPKKCIKSPGKGKGVYRDRRRIVVPNEFYRTQVASEVVVSVQNSSGHRSHPSKGGKGKGTWKGKGKGFCDEWSYAPSLSPQPSFSPTMSIAPSTSPTTPPPTISHQPSVSIQPSTSLAPSNSPTMTMSPGCEALANGDVFTNGTEVSGYYYFEMSTRSGSNITASLEQLDESLRNVVGFLLVWCGKDLQPQFEKRRILSQRELLLDKIYGVNVHSLDLTLHQRHLRIDGIDVSGKDVMMDQNVYGCDSIDEENCNVFRGDYTVYVRDISELQAQEMVLKQIQNVMEDTEAKELLIGNITNITDVAWIGGVLTKQDRQPTIVTQVNNSGDLAVTSSLSTLGVAIASVGSIITLLFLFSVLRKREISTLSIVEQEVDDDDTIFGNNFERGNAWRHQRGAHILGEDDSVTSNMIDREDAMLNVKLAEKRRLYGMGLQTSDPISPREGDLSGQGQSNDVHTCTSATCKICSGFGNSPNFVSAKICSPTDEGALQDQIINVRNVDLMERPYASPNTVEI